MSPPSKEDKKAKFESACWMFNQGIGNLEAGLRAFFEAQLYSDASGSLVATLKKNNKLDDLGDGISSTREEIEKMLSLLGANSKQKAPKIVVQLDKKRPQKTMVILVRRGVTRCLSGLKTLSNESPQNIRRVLKTIHQNQPNKKGGFEKYWKDRLSALLSILTALGDIVEQTSKRPEKVVQLVANKPDQSTSKTRGSRGRSKKKPRMGIRRNVTRARGG